MKLIFHILILGFGAHFISLLFPLQTLWVIMLLYGFMLTLPDRWSFLLGFIAIFLLWTIYAFGIDYNNQHILSGRIGDLIGIGGFWVPILTGLIGGVLGGLSIWTGQNLRRLVFR